MERTWARALAAGRGFGIRRGDWDGVLTLGTDNLAKMVILPAVLIGTFHFPAELVFGRILPGLALTLCVGLGIFSWQAARLARRGGRDDMTALPYGVSTPVLFVFLYAVIGPVFFAGGDALTAYRVALGAAFIGGLVEMSGALIGPWLIRVTPRAGILGTVAGVAIVWIAMVPSGIIFANPVIGLPALFVVLLGLVGRYRFPFRLPTGLVAIGLGVALGLLTGDATFSFGQADGQGIGLYPPVPMIGDLWIGLKLVLARPDILAIVIPIEIYNFMETIGNVETARGAGDEYPLRRTMLLDGAGTLLGAVFGSPFPTTVYLGQPAYKQLGSRTAYAPLTGAFLLTASLFGLFAFLQNLIPPAAISSLLLFVGIVMTQYSFQAAPPGHGVAIAFALIPHMADLLKKQLDGTLLEVFRQGGVAPELVGRLASNQGVYLESYGLLSRGAIITGMLWGSILACIIDHDLRRAAFFAALATGLSLVGMIHAPRIGLSPTPITIGYAVLTAVLAGSYAVQVWRESHRALPVAGGRVG